MSFSKDARVAIGSVLLAGLLTLAVFIYSSADASEDGLNLLEQRVQTDEVDLKTHVHAEIEVLGAIIPRIEKRMDTIEGLLFDILTEVKNGN